MVLEYTLQYYLFTVCTFFAGLSVDFFRPASKQSPVSFNRPAKMAKQWNPFHFKVYVLHQNCETTPSPAQDLQHMQAGLGKRTLLMHEDMTHSEVIYLSFFLLHTLSSSNLNCWKFMICIDLHFRSPYCLKVLIQRWKQALEDGFCTKQLVWKQKQNSCTLLCMFQPAGIYL